MPTESYDEVRTLMLSLALSRKDAIPIAVLDQDYYDVQEERIPWRKFGYPDLIAFLRSMPQSFHIEWQNGCHYVHGIASEKSKHVSSLVSRQKSDVKSKNHHFRQHRSVNRYTPRMQRQRVRIPAEQLHFIIEHIKYNPDGLSIQNIIMILQKQLPQVKLSVQDVREQLRELQHQLFMDGEIIFPVSPFNHIPQKPTNYQNSSTPQLQTQSAHDRKVQNEYIAGDEDWMEDHDNIQNDYLPAGCESSNYSTQMTSERLTANFAQNTNDKQMTMPEYNDYDKKININEYFTTNNCSNIVTDSKDEVPGERCTDASTLISDRTKSRLEELVRKYPDGIWCAELPDKYLNEYKVRLNYTELGFSSVREYVSYMPNIFYMTRMKANDDFILFSADKRPTIPDQESSGSQTAESVGTGKRYDEHNPRTRCNNDDAIPTNIPTSITSKFIPDDVMNYNDSVDLISVIDLQCKEYLEVYIAESFNPSFFWIHLRENKKSLYSLMDNLHYFYQNNYESYTIPKVALNKGLNCACVFGERWHRAIIKNVKPDYRVTVFFYDFGTVKTYPPETVFYLHKEFSRFPAHGIPCGLYNIKPCVGDRWKRSVNNQFMDKIADNVFVATVNSIDPTHNSMMITLTDTSEEEHININDWLVNQNLARQGKLVRICDNFTYPHYIGHNNIEIQSPIEVPDTRNKVEVEVVEARYEKDQSMSRDKKMHRLSNDYPRNENIGVRNAEILRNVSYNGQAIVQILRSMDTLEAKSSDTKSDIDADIRYELNNCSETEIPKGPKGLNMLLEKFKTLNSSFSDPNLDVSTSEINNLHNNNFLDNVQQLDSNMKIDVEMLDNDKNSLSICFTMRDSDDEETNFRDFGTFRSMYGGHGMMEPIDWSLIEKDRVSSCKSAPPTSANNLDILIKERMSNVAKDKIELHSQKKDELPAKPYFLNMTRKEEEYFLAEGNINYDVRNVSHALIKLRNRLKMCNDKYTTMTVTREVLKILRDVQSQITPSPEVNATINNTSFSRKMTNEKENGDISKEANEARLNQKMENKNSAIIQKSASCSMNNSRKKNNQEICENSSNDSFESNTTNQLFNNKYKKLMKQMKQIKCNPKSDSSFTDTNESCIPEETPSSSNHSSDDTLISTSISTDEKQDETYTRKNTTRFNKLRSLAKCTSTNSNYLKSDSDSETKAVFSESNFINSDDVEDSKQCKSNYKSSENDSIVPRNFENSKQCEPNYQSLENQSSNSIVSCNIKESQQYQPNATVMTSLKNKILQLILKMQNISSNTDLDSDDLSNEETVKNNKNNKSSDKKDDESINESVSKNRTCKSMNLPMIMNVSDEVAPPPIFDDCNVESDDSMWDANEESFLSLLNLFPR